MENRESGKPHARLLGALVPLALVELLVSKGVITEDELNEAIAKALLKSYSELKATEGKREPEGGERSGKQSNGGE